MDNKKFQKFQNIMTKLIKIELFLLKIHRHSVIKTQHFFLNSFVFLIQNIIKN